MLVSLKILGSLVRTISSCLSLFSAGRSWASWLHPSGHCSPGKWAENLERLSTVLVGDGSYNLKPWGAEVRLEKGSLPKKEPKKT